MDELHEPVISIVTASMNCRDLLEKTLDAVRDQNYGKIQHIIIDGGSKDGTDLLLKNRSSQLYYVVSEPDKNLYDAMNKGLAAATGDFVYFLNSGDVFADASVLKNMAKSMTRSDTCYFGQLEVRARYGNWMVPGKVSDKIEDGSYLPHHQTIFYPRSFYASNRYNDALRIHADVDFTHRAVKQTKLKFVDLMIAVSTIGGIGTQVFRSFAGTKYMVSEYMRINRLQHNPMTFKKKFVIYVGCAAKFALCKALGDDVLHQLYRFTASMRFRVYR